MRYSTLIASAALALTLTACGSEREGTFTTEEGDTGEYSIDTDTGETSMTIETEDGVATLRAGPDVDAELPGGFSIIDGAEVMSNTVVDAADGKGALVTFNSDKSPEEIADLYRAQAESAGVEIQIETSINGGKMLGGEGPDGLTFSILAYPNEEEGGEGTLANLTVGSGIN